MTKQHFEEFFICPHCKEPLVRKEDFTSYASDKRRFYCSNCGGKISNTLVEVLENLKTKEVR